MTTYGGHEFEDEEPTVEIPPPAEATVIPCSVPRGLPILTTPGGFVHLVIPTWSVTLCGWSAVGEMSEASGLTLVDCLGCLDKYTRQSAKVA